MTQTQRIAFALIGGVVVVTVYYLARPDESPKGPVGATPSETVSATAPPIVSAPRPPASPPDAAAVVTTGQPVDLGTAVTAAKKIQNARTALAAGDAKKALAEIEEYQHMPEATALKQEAVVVKIEALAKVGGRRTDALALAMSTRDDPEFAPYQGQIAGILADAGL